MLHKLPLEDEGLFEISLLGFQIGSWERILKMETSRENLDVSVFLLQRLLMKHA